MANYLNEEIRQIKLYPPGCQTVIVDTITVNDLFFCYSSTMTVVVFSIKNNRLKGMINLDNEKYVKSIALNKGERYELAIFYDYEIILYDIKTFSTTNTFKCDKVCFMEFNSDNKLIALNSLNELHLVDIAKGSIQTLKIRGKATKVQWYPFNSGDFAYANTDNEISYQNINEKSRRSYVELDRDKAIAQLAWYNSDENFKYVIVGFKTCELFLVDLSIKNPGVIIQFDKHGKSLGSLIWLKPEPGNFFSIARESGRITIWNVSKKSYKEITKFADYPILNCVPFSDGKKLLMSLENGMVQIYDIIYKKVHFLITPGHSETVFDLKVSPFHYGLFATCGYDGNIKVWNMTTNAVSLTLKVNEPGMVQSVKIYSLKWSPVEKNLLLSGDSENAVRVWDIAKQKAISSLVLGKMKGEVVGLDWNSTDQIIATCLDNAYVISYEMNKLVLKTAISAKVKLFQCKFNQSNEKQFAVACFDGGIRFYSTTPPAKEGVNEVEMKYTGHTHKVFGLAFNPKLNFLASSSDDFKVGVWDTTTGKPNFMVGHTNNVRQVVWITETPKLLISGSWDGTARIWNIDYRICIGLINDHHSDVYGIDISPHHPFLIITSSRDNSIRFWNYLKNPIEFIISFTSEDKADLYLSFPRLEKELLSIKNDPISKAEVLCNFFFYLDGIKELFDILRVVLKVKEHNNENNRLFYIGDLYSAFKSKVLGLEFNYYSQKKFDYNVKKEAFLKEAIELSAKCGDWEKFCELSVVLGEWKQAIMAAPNVSMAYWGQLTEKYSEYLLNEKNATEKERVMAALNASNSSKAIELIGNSDKYEDAKIVWLSRTIQEIEKKQNETRKAKYNDKTTGFFSDEDFGEDINSKLESLSNDSRIAKITHQIAKEKLSNCAPIEAACAFLSVSNIPLCIKTLVRTNELEVAYFIMKLTNNLIYESDILFGLISKQVKANNINHALLIVEEASNADLKTLLYLSIMLKAKIDEEQEKKFNALVSKCTNSYVQLLVAKDYKGLYDTFNQLTAELVSNLANETIVKENIREVLSLFAVVQVFNWRVMDESINKAFYLRILCSCSALEMLNKNRHSTYAFLYLINDLLKQHQVEVVNQIDKELISIAYSSFDPSSNKDKQLDALSSVCSLKQGKCDKLLAAFEKINDYDINKYSCDQMNQFYYLREGKFPINTKEMAYNSITRKVIKGQAVKVGSFSLSLNEVMEISKYIPRMFNE